MNELIRFVIEPLSLGLVQRGLAAAVVVAVLCGVLGSFVVVRGLAFLGDALGHAVFPGVVVAYGPVDAVFTTPVLHSTFGSQLTVVGDKQAVVVQQR